MTNSLVFIVGYPRSGTTFLQSLLSTQAGIVSFPETHFFSSVIHELVLKNDLVNLTELRTIKERLKKVMLFDFSAPINKKVMEAVNNQSLHLSALFLYLLEDYIQQKKYNITQKTIFLEKTPSHARSIQLIKRIFPTAKFIAIIRHPLATTYSYYNNLNQEERQTYKILGFRWDYTIDKIENFAKTKPTEIQIITYENLLVDTSKTINSLTNFVDISFNKLQLKNAPKMARNFILPYETWKEKNTKVIQSNKNPNIENIQKLNLIQTLWVQHYCGHKMLQYGYRIQYKPIQLFFDRFITIAKFVKYKLSF